MELGLERCLQARHVPLLLDGFFGHELPENVRDDAGAQPRHQGGNVLCIKNLVALRVDFLALVVGDIVRSEEHTSELQSQSNLVCRLLLEKKKKHHSAPSYNSHP